MNAVQLKKKTFVNIFCLLYIRVHLLLSALLDHCIINAYKYETVKWTSKKNEQGQPTESQERRVVLSLNVTNVEQEPSRSVPCSSTAADAENYAPVHAASTESSQRPAAQAIVLLASSVIGKRIHLNARNWQYDAKFIFHLGARLSCDNRLAW